MDNLDKLEQTERVLKLLYLRSITFNKTTETILSLLGDTLIAAMYDVFDASYEDISWNDISIVDQYLVLLATVTYPLDKQVPEIVQAIGQPLIKENSTNIQKIIRIGIPITKIFDDKQEIVNHIKQTTQSMISPHQELKSSLPTTGEEISNNTSSEEKVNVIPITDDQLEFILSSLTNFPIKH